VWFTYNAELRTIDIGDYDLEGTKKYRDAPRRGRAALVVDDTLPPSRQRAIEVRRRIGLRSERRWFP
jgi:hypothetical protein